MNRIMSYLPKTAPFLASCKATICTRENASMNVGTMINALLNYGMRSNTMKQSGAKKVIALEKKQNL